MSGRQPQRRHRRGRRPVDDLRGAEDAPVQPHAERIARAVQLHRGAAARGGDCGGDVEHAPAELPIPRPAARGRLLEQIGDLRGGKQRIRRPDESRRARDLGRRERRAAREAVQAQERAGERHPWVGAGPGERRDRAEDAVAGRGDRDVGAFVGEASLTAGRRRGRYGEPRSAAPVRPDRLQERGWVLHRVARSAIVSGGGDEEDAVGGRVGDGVALRRRGGLPADAEVDDARAVVDGVGDRIRLVEVGERSVRAARLDDQQLGIPAEARDPVAVRDRPCGESGHERAVTVRVAHVAVARAHVVDGRVLRGDVRRREVGAGVDDRDRDRRRRPQHPVGNRGLVHGVELPLEREAVRACRVDRGFRAGGSGHGPLDVADPGAARRGSADDRHPQRRHDPDDL